VAISAASAVGGRRADPGRRGHRLVPRGRDAPARWWRWWRGSSSAGFALDLANFGSYNATHGTLGGLTRYPAAPAAEPPRSRTDRPVYGREAPGTVDRPRTEGGAMYIGIGTAVLIILIIILLIILL
jgi:hypothetical protein